MSGRADVPGSEDFGRELRRHRRLAGLSLSALAALVSYSKSHLSRIESGAKAPTVPLARRCDAVLGADGRLTALVAHRPRPTTDRPRPADDAAGTVLGELLRDAVAALSGSTGDVWTASRLAPERTVAAFERMLDDFRALGQSHPPIVVTTLMGTPVGTLHELARNSTASERTAFLRLTARFYDYVGWMQQEQGRDTVSLSWIQRTRAVAVAAQDEAMAAYSWIRQGEIALYRGDSLSTVELAERAQAATTSMRVRGLGALTEAQGHALHGDAGRCQDALERAEAWLGATADGEEPGPQIGSSTMPDPLAFVTAWCLNDLGRPFRSRKILESELLRLPVQAHRTRARYGARLALTLAGTGDVGRMCEVLAAVLGTASDVDSATVRADLRLVLREATRWRAVPAFEATLRELAVALQPRDQRPRA